MTNESGKGGGGSTGARSARTRPRDEGRSTDLDPMDLEGVADELYGLLPGEFVAARDARAAQARKAGGRDLADRIRALRRPTVSAWASNLLVRERADQVERLVDLGRALRHAHQELDGERLRELSRRRHALVTALASQARQLAADAGQPVGEQARREVETTLHAVLADQDAAERWAAGRLARPLSPPVGFTAARAAAPAPTSGPVPAGRTGQAGRAGRKSEAATVGDLDEARRRRAGRRREERRRAEFARAREAARAAEREVTSLTGRLRRAEAERDRAQAAWEETDRRAADLRQRLEETEEQRRTARREVDDTRSRAREAERAVREARRTARDAATVVERLAADGP
ncbi:hypothetical protein [Streptomyces sp. NRRL F-5135]|uniref:hypothetical protein n=1 Tax=Streptomyces sp. NRRL F-5135 TaxID=1463858 RepID=UPI001F2FBCBE|nr:hypothetical protein [Streptomyces sp. NRRL F-5135]